MSPFVGYKRVATDNTLMVGVSVPLKIRDRNQAGIARAEADAKMRRLGNIQAPVRGDMLRARQYPCTE